MSRAIDSALSQTEPDTEVVVLDDASTDDTLEVISAYTDSRVRIAKNDRHLGLAGSHNRCLEIAQGTYVVILCDDDLLYPYALAWLADGLDRFPEATLATSAWNWIDADDSLLRTTRLLKNAPVQGTLIGLRKIVAMSWLYRNRMGGCLLRRDALAALRFNPDYAQMMDWDLWLRLLKRGPLVYFPQVLGALRFHDDSLTARNRLLAQSASDLLSMSSHWADPHSELHGAVSKFELERLRMLCFLRAIAIALGNVVRGDWQKVGVNLSVAKRALVALVR